MIVENLDASEPPIFNFNRRGYWREGPQARIFLPEQPPDLPGVPTDRTRPEKQQMTDFITMFIC
jgi:hypothetical protein